VPQQRENPVGVLVIRASVEDLDELRLLVHIVEVNPPLPDRKVGIVSSAQAAVALVGEWLDSLVGASPRPSGTESSRAPDR
jgi:hypothetical protein